MPSMGRLRARPAVVTAAAAVLTVGSLGACANPESSTSPNAGAGGQNTQNAPSTAPSGGEQVVQTPATPAGEGCTLQRYGAQQVDLKNAVVGFSQSEKEANPFRIAETQSIKAEAERVGVKQLLTTNANSQLSKQISDIQDMLARGAQVLIVAPLNSDGLEPALRQARAKKVPVITIDRKINAEWCQDYVTFIGSDFVEQGKRAADAMIQATGATRRSRSCSAPPATT